MSKRVLILYVPVLHEGYLRFFKKYADSVETAYIVSAPLVKEHTFLEREIRAVDPELMRSLVASLGIFKDVQLLDEATARSFNTSQAGVEFEIVTADEQISRRIAAAYFPQAKLVTDSVFLRWDEASVASQHAPENARVSTDAFDISMIERGAELSNGSSCWWRHVGGVIVKDGEVILEAHNAHVPSPHTPYAHGDPRDVVQAGKTPEIATTMHAEQRLITQAAKEGIALRGTSLYTTVFPCPMCAKLIAYAGIQICYYASGHASLDGESIMKANGVELVFVKMPEAAA